MTQVEIDAACAAARENTSTISRRGIPKNVRGHLASLVAEAGRKFSLPDDEKEELEHRLYYSLVKAATFGKWDCEKASFNTYLCRVINLEMYDWRAERFAAVPRQDETDAAYKRRIDAEAWRDRRILYSPSRYGTVAKMVRLVDWNLAVENLESDELCLLERYVYGNGTLKESGKLLGYGKNKTLEMFAEIKRKLSAAYGRRLK